MNVGSLFSGIGGLELGLERTGGFRTVWQCEADPWARSILARHWPGVPCYPDVRELPLDELAPVDALCGGFPCQDISQAGKGAGIAEGTRSGLWFAYLRAVRALRPRYVIVENVAILARRGLDVVLGGLAASGYDVEWDCIPAAAVGAHHRRDRLFIVAYPHDGGRLHRQAPVLAAEGGLAALGQPGAGGSDVGDADRSGLAFGTCLGGDARAQLAAAFRASRARGGMWESEPDVGRVADWVPSRVDRLRGLGNAVVPHVAEWIGQRILERERVLNA